MNDWQAVLLEPAGSVLAQIGHFLVNILLDLETASYLIG